MGSQDHLDSQVYDVVMIAMTILGVVVNISAIIILQRKNQSSMFHSLLKVRNNFTYFMTLWFHEKKAKFLHRGSINSNQR